MIELGQEGKDKITGFKGIIVARSSWITGCDQYLLSPKAEKGKLKEAAWFDEGRIEITGKGITKASIKSKKTGGPQMFLPEKY